MLMPYGQNVRGNGFSIVINALRAKEKITFKQFISIMISKFKYILPFQIVYLIRKEDK